MKKTIYLLFLIFCFSSCKDTLNKTDINLRRIKNEYCNGKMIAIFRIKRIMSNKFIKINITDTLTINGIKMDSVVYAIVADSLST